MAKPRIIERRSMKVPVIAKPACDLTGRPATRWGCSQDMKCRPCFLDRAADNWRGLLGARAGRGFFLSPRTSPSLAGALKSRRATR
jgi:hypothetical protein